MNKFDSPCNVFVKTTKPPHARFKADCVDNHTKGLITFRLKDEVVAQLATGNIEYWYIEEEMTEREKGILARFFGPMTDY